MRIIISVFRSFDMKFLITSYLISVLIFLTVWKIIPTNKMSYMLLLIVNAILYPFSRMVYYQIRNMINKRSKETVRKSNIITHLILKVLLAIGLFVFSILIAPFGFAFLTIRVLRMEKKEKKQIKKSEKRILR
ncbi:hypothetical protein I6G77_28225 (plasmid) [Bacillus tropicus]|uniref:Uncharacterized protein n=1 Tax=Bacillus tropicus TaxID=2026188 RepID=A0A7T2QKW9_9BACI|nr:hypothetical protein [Bacillus tropicus]AJG91348.1 hypothetical protein BG03_5740 [Bacillus cereus]QPR80426.1 hypothetical protein I6G77_28225 [Bacillus tropicus]